MHRLPKPSIPPERPAVERAAGAKPPQRRTKLRARWNQLEIGVSASHNVVCAHFCGRPGGWLICGRRNDACGGNARGVGSTRYRCRHAVSTRMPASRFISARDGEPPQREHSLFFGIEDSGPVDPVTAIGRTDQHGRQHYRRCKLCDSGKKHSRDRSQVRYAHTLSCILSVASPPTDGATDARGR